MFSPVNKPINGVDGISTFGKCVSKNKLVTNIVLGTIITVATGISEMRFTKKNSKRNI